MEGRSRGWEGSFSSTLIVFGSTFLARPTIGVTDHILEAVLADEQVAPGVFWV